MQGHATIYCAPHSLKFDWLPTKKPRNSHGTPEVHVAVNFASPIPGAASIEMGRKSAPCSYTSSPDNKSLTRPSSSSEFNPPIRLLLELMDINDPSSTFKYIEFEDELRKMGLRGKLDVYRTPRVLLVTFGDLKWYGANHLHKYIEERLMPLIIPGEKADGTQERGSTVEEGGSMSAGTQNVEGNEAICKEEDLDACSDIAVEDDGHLTSSWKGKGKVMKEESREVIMVWPSDDDEEVEAALPPIAVLDDAGNTLESSKSFASAEAVSHTQSCTRYLLNIELQYSICLSVKMQGRLHSTLNQAMYSQCWNQPYTFSGVTL